jgi:periplasmic copper chaperone A
MRRDRTRSRMRNRRDGVVVLLLTPLLACSGPASSPSGTLGAGEPDLHVSLVQASAPIAGASQLVLTVENRGDGDDRMLGAESDAALAVEIHRTVVEADGRASMRMLDDVIIPAGGSVAFRPGGLHLMLVVPDERVVVGGTFEVTLRFERTGPVTLTVPVVDLLDLLEREEGDGGADGR